MKTYSRIRTKILPVVGTWVVSLLLLGVATAAQGQPATEAGVQVLTRGPVHEAFAEASMTGATAGVVITKAPPDPIAELPPDQKPEGVNVAWIPGYWSWDDDRNSFIWVSGVWRDLPPGRQWVPGYWTPVQGGSQWISGFWGEVAKTEVTYLPPPPAPLEAGPSSPAPAPDNIWTPGCWVWRETRYDWQPGYWVVQQPDWIWSPAHYTWTPRGYVYVPGYWDHDIVHRGVMFAPVYYDQPVYANSGYLYSPSTVIDLAVMAACLFVQPRSNHYYYGDYYDAGYERRGIFPWQSKQALRYGADPLYVQYRAMQLRHDPEWDAHMNEQFQYRREHVDARPPHTLALQANLINNAQTAGVMGNLLIGKSLAEAAQSKTLPLRLTPVNMEERKQIATHGQEVHKFQLERAKIETAPAPKAVGKSKGARETAQPVSVQLPVSPVAAKASENLEGAKTPPPVPVAPKPQAAPEVKTRKGEAKTAPPTTPKKPEKAKSTGHVPPESTEARPLVTNEKSQRVEPKTETTKPESTPKKVAPKPEPSKQGNVEVKTKPKSETTQGVESTRSKKVEAKPQAKTPKTPQVQSKPKATEAKPQTKTPKPPQAQSKPKTVEPKREPPKTEALKPEVKSQEPENKKSEEK